MSCDAGGGEGGGAIWLRVAMNVWTVLTLSLLLGSLASAAG